MSVAARHPLYTRSLPRWIKCRACREGEEEVKEETTKFLPALSNQSSEDYANYLARASYYNATARTVDALTGMLFLKPPTHSMPNDLEEVTKNIGIEEESLFKIATNIADELVTLGRCLALVDAPVGEGESPVIVIYQPEAVINWKFEVVDGIKQPTMIVIEEAHEVEGEDVFDVVEETRWRVLLLDRDELGFPYYRVEIWEKLSPSDVQQVKTVSGAPAVEEYRKIEDIVPTAIGGKRLSYIPAQFFDAEGTLNKISKPPILDLVNLNLSHFRNSADLEWGLHFVALPTPVVIGGGFTKGKNQPNPVLPLGATVAWDIPNEKATVKMLEFSGAGLQSISTAMERKERQMAVVGGRMLEQQKAQVERSEAVKLRMVGDSSVLAGIADQLSNGISWLLRIVAEWNQIGTEKERADLTYTVSRDFVAFSVDPQLLVAIALLVQKNLLSYEDFYELAKRASLVPMDRSLKDHLTKVLDTTSQDVLKQALEAIKDFTAGNSAPESSTSTTA